mgnify:FL=1
MNDYTITSVQRALRILKLFLPDNQPMTLKQIADESDLNKSTALRMTTTLLNSQTAVTTILVNLVKKIVTCKFAGAIVEKSR